MVTALIFAGGEGHRMHSGAIPKQFLEIHGKPILLYTLEIFAAHPAVDAIVVVCLSGWIDRLQALLEANHITKVRGIVPGGNTGHDSIFCGLQYMQSFSQPEDIVLIHDGVRPWIDQALISRNIQTTQRYGSAVTVEKARESIVRSLDGETIREVPRREEMYIAKAPQSFRFGQIWAL